MRLYVYPKVFRWDQLVPIEYPFIKMAGPDGAIGVLLVFDTLEKYSIFCEDDYMPPIVIKEMERHGGKK